METEKNYLIKVFGLGYRGQYRLPLFGKVDIDRINDPIYDLNSPTPKDNIYICGGGRKNKFLFEKLK